MMRYYLSLGANLGEREATITKALALLADAGCTVVATSERYYSAPVGFVSEHRFCNICAAVDCDLEPEPMLLLTQEIERQLGRTAKSTTDEQGKPVHYDRSIDIDLILAFDGERQITSDTPHLTLPHPRYRERDFVMIPLRQITNCQ